VYPVRRERLTREVRGLGCGGWGELGSEEEEGKRIERRVGREAWVKGGEGLRVELGEGGE